MPTANSWLFPSAAECFSKARSRSTLLTFKRILPCLTLFVAVSIGIVSAIDSQCPPICSFFTHSDASDPREHKELKKARTVAAPRKRIRPYSNGCSVPEFLRASMPDYSHFTPCCDLHDTCYMSCGASKAFCDKEFERCMKRDVCAKSNHASRQECNQLADMFALGVSMFGCNGYQELQREGCECLDSSEAWDRTREYVEQFYSVYNGTHTFPQSMLEKHKLHSHEEKNDHGKQHNELHGRLLYMLYRKYPKSIDIISRDGISGRQNPTFFEHNPTISSEL